MANRFEPNQEHTCGVFLAKRKTICPECGQSLDKGQWGAMWKNKAVHVVCHLLAKKANTQTYINKDGKQLTLGF
jgi:hypothetical protein